MERRLEPFQINYSGGQLWSWYDGQPIAIKAAMLLPEWVDDYGLRSGRQIVWWKVHNDIDKRNFEKAIAEAGLCNYGEVA